MIVVDVDNISYIPRNYYYIYQRNLIDFGKTLGLHLHTLEGVWNTNLKVRPERDWEKLEGRAIIKDTTDDYRRSVVAESNDPFNEMF